jgi:nitrite reductase/ring-hydroxylating ferredoxin subunit
MSAWTRVLAAAGLEPGSVHAVDLDGAEVVVFCGRSGRLGAVARTCPHLDWDLADGIVIDDELMCPGHGWSFTPDGRALKRNEAGRVDDKGAIGCYGVRVVDGWAEVESPAAPAAD